MFNGCELTQSLWPFAIHSNNPEMIHLLEENNIKPEMNIEILTEAIKCHHNNIVNYIKHNYTGKKSLPSSFQYYNYEIISQNEDDDNALLKHSCIYNYVELVKILLQNEIILIF
ncbi:hypothetical protein M9Y10_006281 [Tritrichomonas musculus]|uniref:DUF3447 domain-containing protein n=1 Tax=Tritrichomonas musculus TaxID=1915356 RepID=A0ABR2JDS4_9EUKA